MKKMILAVFMLGLVAWPNVRLASAQGGVRDIVVLPRVVHGGDPASNFDFLKAVPVVAFADTKVSHPGQFANRHDWAVSEDGEEPATFNIDDYFDFSFDLTLTGTPPGTAFAQRKEAGIIITTAIAGEGQYLVNTDGHEVVAFGGPFPFYKFDLSYNSGDRISLRLRYFRDEADGKRKIQYYANDQTSGPLVITNLEQGIPGPFFVKGYLQTVISEADSDNRAVAVYDNIRWNGALIGN